VVVAGEGREPEAPSAAASSSEPPTAGESLASGLANLVANPATYLVAGLVVAAVASKVKPSTETVIALSALPVVGLTAISKTKVGESIANKVEEDKVELLPLATRRERERVAAREKAASGVGGEGAGLGAYFGPARRTLVTPAPDHLTGVLPGDAGFDPLGLARQEAAASAAAAADENAWRDGAYAGTRLGSFFEAELLHGRWAMLAAIGCLIPEALARYAGFDAIAEPVWWKVGYSVLHDGVEINYAGLQGFRIAGDKGLLAIAACQLVLMGGPEYARKVGIESLEPVGIFLPGSINFPGGQLFDPLGLSEQPEAFLLQQVREQKNGRLAMLAMLGYAAQAAVTREGPLENLERFISDPLHENLFAYLATGLA